MSSLLDLIHELSEEGCTDLKAIDIATDLMKQEYIKKQFKEDLNEGKIAKVIEATNNMTDIESTMYRALSSLSKREKECYSLHVIELMSMGKIAKKLGVSKGAVNNYIRRAREKINQNAMQEA